MVNIGEHWWTLVNWKSICTCRSCLWWLWWPKDLHWSSCMKATKSHIGRDVAGETCKEQRDRQATLPLLQSDPKLFCVSAWNDNGRPDLVQNANSDLPQRSFLQNGSKWQETMCWNCRIVMICHDTRFAHIGPRMCRTTCDCCHLIYFHNLPCNLCDGWRNLPHPVDISVATPVPRISFLVSVGCCWAASGMKSRANGPTRSLAETNPHAAVRPICNISVARRRLTLRYWDDFLRRSDIRRLAWDGDGHDMTGCWNSLSRIGVS